MTPDLLLRSDAAGRPTAARPTRIRYRVLAFGMGLAALTYLDRVCLSIMAKDIMRDLSLDEVRMSLVFSAFTLAYAVFEIPTAWWAERIGARRVLTRIVAAWSLCTMLTAGAWNHYSLLAARFLFGVGEAGAFPCMARAIAAWFPSTELGVAQGLMFMGGHLVGGLTPVLVAAALLIMPWRAVLLLFGAVGFVWVLGWRLIYRDEPAQHPSVNNAELDLIANGRKTPSVHVPVGLTWKALLSNRNVIALCLMYFTQGYGFYFFITWLPTYLQKERGFSLLRLGFFSGLPLLFSVAADLAGGLATDWVSRKFGLRLGRSAVGGLAFLVAGLAMISGTATSSSLLSIVLLSLAASCPHFALAASWGACVDIGGRNAGVVSACMNTSGQIAGVLSPIVIGIILGQFQNWTAPLYLTGALYLAGSFCWLFIDVGKPLRVAG